MIDDSINVKIFHLVYERLVLEEHRVHRLAQADQNAFRQTLHRAIQIVFVAKTHAARGKFEIGRVHKRAAPLREHLGKAPENRIARHADKTQAILFLGQRSDVMRDFVFHFLHEFLEILAARRRAAQRVRNAHIDRAFVERIERRGRCLVQFEHALPRDAHIIREFHRLAQLVHVEFFAGELLAQRDQLAELKLNVLAVVLEIRIAGHRVQTCRARAGRIECERGVAVPAFPNLAPL